MTLEEFAPCQRSSWVTAPALRVRIELVLMTDACVAATARSAQSPGPSSGTGEKTYVSALSAEASTPWAVRCQVTVLEAASTQCCPSASTASRSLLTESPTDSSPPLASLT